MNELLLNDISNINDIKLLVDSFYSKVSVDLLIGPIFTGVLKDHWGEHLTKMYRFWETVLLDANSYAGNPFPPHAQMPLEKKHFDTWLSLWKKTIDQYFRGPKADEAKSRSDKMAIMFLSKITYYKDNNIRPLI